MWPISARGWPMPSGEGVCPDIALPLGQHQADVPELGRPADEHDVRRLDVPVHQCLLVEVGQSLRKLLNDRGGLLKLQLVGTGRL